MLCGVLATVLTFGVSGTARAQDAPQTAPAHSATPTATPHYPKTGISVSGAVITPGEVMQELWGAIGPPDHVQAVRGKEASGDCVRFSYRSYGISVRIANVNNRDNIVDSILVLQSNVRLVNVPFKVGDNYKTVMQIWGQPDQQETGYMAYWKRGVYVAVDGHGTITAISLVEPGKFVNPPHQKVEPVKAS